MSPNTFTAAGAAVTAPATGMTQSNLRALLRLTLASTSDWPDATLNQWLREAIRAYSAEFPRPLRHTLTLTAGTQVYALPADALGVTGVEYPAGDEPPEMLTQTDEHGLWFRAGGACYALLGAADSGSLDAVPYLAQIRFAGTVATGESAVVHYAGLHQAPAQDGDYTSVPRAHTDALLAFGEFRAAVELERDASWKECITNDKLGALSGPAQAAWRRWREVMDHLPRPATQGPNWVSWAGIGL